jgi:hypothetical protein
MGRAGRIISRSPLPLATAAACAPCVRTFAVFSVCRLAWPHSLARPQNGGGAVEEAREAKGAVAGSEWFSLTLAAQPSVCLT